MTAPVTLSAGFCAPILWGVRQAYSIEQIAEGLGIDARTVMRAIELHSGIEFPDLRALPGIEVDRVDWRYANWRRAREGAAVQLDGFAQGAAHV